MAKALAHLSCRMSATRRSHGGRNGLLFAPLSAGDVPASVALGGRLGRGRRAAAAAAGKGCRWAAASHEVGHGRLVWTLDSRIERAVSSELPAVRQTIRVFSEDAGLPLVSWQSDEERGMAVGRGGGEMT